jgi:glycosyltransferase involved in cell wall biosynthesis
VQALAADLKVDPVLLGPVHHEELPSLVAAAGAFAFPSLQEGFGLAAMEALAAGVPVVTRDLPVFREVFAGAVRFAREDRPPDDPADDSLAGRLRHALAETASEREAAAEPGRRLAAGHTWDDAAAAHLALYQDLALVGLG